MVRQRADALMLSGESAIGAYPEKALGVLRQVSTRIEEWVRCCLPTTAPLSSLHKHTFLARMSALSRAQAHIHALAHAHEYVYGHAHTHALARKVPDPCVLPRTGRRSTGR